ncbi:hypothetical protein K466DRAFT_607716 [Polyporus arcularius HHB13444]|uniref:Uncharacterized protein n=1 Tax=Polyporus arcularius HHB13444 TaxID=1314778 RepID=A0A5C3NKN9_9APHY|nr:hypothetical protein K466DRAFT_607716 [Polyporus arcularius HHB13444]
MYEIPDQPELPSPSHQPIPAVYGLHVTPEPYVFCAGCAHGFKNLKTLRLHKCTMEAPPSASSTHHYAQTLFNHPKCFIAVAIPEANNRTPLSYRLRQLLRDARDHLSAPPAATTPITAPTHTDAAMAFIRQEQWDKEVLGLNPVQVSEWVSLDENHPILSKMRPVCASYLGKVHALLLSAPDPIKTALARFNE